MSEFAHTDFTYNFNDTYLALNPPPAGENPKRRQLEYDTLGRLTSVCEITSASQSGNCSQQSSASGYLTQYFYQYQSSSPAGYAWSVNQSGESRNYVYDGLGRLISETNPESGTKSYTYDSITTGPCPTTSAGDLVLSTDANGNSVCYWHDALHRLTDMGSNKQSTTNPCHRLRYDNTTPPSGINVGYGLGRLVEAKTDNCSGTTLTDEWFGYGIRGDQTDAWESTPNSGGWYHVQRGYMSNGATATLQGFFGTGTTTSFTDKFAYAFDGEGRPNAAADWTSPGSQIWSSTTYNSGSQPTQVNLLGASESFTYNFSSTDKNYSGIMNSWTSTAGSNTQTGTLTWNTNGTLQQLNVTDSYNPGANNEVCTYNYDDLGRLGVNSTTWGVNCVQGSQTLWQQVFTYDPLGNMSKDGTLTFGAYYNNKNQITNMGFQYDAAGNITNTGSDTLSYDVYNRSNVFDGITTTYDGLGRPVERGNNGTYTQVVYSPTGDKLAFMNGQSVNQYLIPLVAGMKAVYNGSGGNTALQFFRHVDWLGSTRFDSTPSGGVYFDGLLAPFGEPYAGKGTTDLSFTGQTQDTVSGYYDFPMRQYSPVESRWLNPDPGGLSAVDPSNPQTWNRYAYVANNPLSNIDPQGLNWCVRGGGDDDDDDDDDDDAGSAMARHRARRDGCIGGDDDDDDTQPPPPPPPPPTSCTPGTTGCYNVPTQQQSQCIATQTQNENVAMQTTLTNMGAAVLTSTAAGIFTGGLQGCYAGLVATETTAGAETLGLSGIPGCLAGGSAWALIRGGIAYGLSTAAFAYQDMRYNMNLPFLPSQYQTELNANIQANCSQD